jgi:hypothetical protein
MPLQVRDSAVMTVAATISATVKNRPKNTT